MNGFRHPINILLYSLPCTYGVYVGHPAHVSGKNTWTQFQCTHILSLFLLISRTRTNNSNYLFLEILQYSLRIHFMQPIPLEFHSLFRQGKKRNNNVEIDEICLIANEELFHRMEPFGPWKFIVLLCLLHENHKFWL